MGGVLKSIDIAGFNTFDFKIDDVLGRSSVDTFAALNWLALPNQVTNATDERKACLLNLMAKLRSVPFADFPLIDYIQSIVEVKEERIYCTADVHILLTLQQWCANPAQLFYAEGQPKADIHQQLLDSIVSHGLGLREDYMLWSFRQEGTHCLQVVVAAPSNSRSQCCVDCDIDLFDPLQDLDGLAGHLNELRYGITDHIALHDALMKQPTGEFIYYDVVNS